MSEISETKESNGGKKRKGMGEQNWRGRVKEGKRERVRDYC